MTCLYVLTQIYDLAVPSMVPVLLHPRWCFVPPLLEDLNTNFGTSMIIRVISHIWPEEEKEKSTMNASKWV